MRSPATMFFVVLFAAALTLTAASHFLDTTVEQSSDNPSSREWREHRQQAEELEKKMRQCKDSVELEKLRRQHLRLYEQWRKKHGSEN
jgi:outer membrane biogenesis lipoprotein LolB